MYDNVPEAQDTVDIGIDTESTTSPRWPLFGKRLPRSEITFFAQVIIVYIVIITCIVNLSLGNGDINLWTALLSSCLGYLLPSPKLKSYKSDDH